MRDQLHLMELVDNYLDGTMSTNDRAAFEERLKNSEELRDLVEDQQRLRRAARRSPARAAAKKAYNKYKWGKAGPGLGAGAVVLIAATATIFLWKSPAGRSTTEEAPVVDSAYHMLADTIGTGIVPLVMVIDPNKDTTMLTPNGVLLDVPMGCFVDSSGTPVTTPVRITMLEAFDGPTIMKAGLSTMSGDTLLETGGMFYIDAQSKGNKLSIAEGRSVNVLVPADGVAPGMKLYDGVLQPEGDIDWQDPVELPRTLVPVDITTLDFYPPGYEAKLAELGQDVTNKAFKDSLYYSMRCPEQGLEMMYEVPQDQEYGEPLVFRGLGAALALIPQSQPLDSARVDSVQRSSKTVIAVGGSDECGIAPAKIKAIWNAHFNGTNLATREFEERIQSIHGTCDNAVLDLYVSNLTEDLSTLDLRAVRLGHNEFAAFAKRNDGRVDLPVESAERLKRVYGHWSRQYADASRRAQETFWARQAELDAKTRQLAQVDARAEQEARAQLLEAETEANLRSVYEQAGYAVAPWRPANVDVNATAQRANTPPPPPVVLPALPRTAFRASIQTTGWKNCDRTFSLASTRQSATMVNGSRQATITYEPSVVTVPDARTYDAVRVYLLPQEGRAYQRMNLMPDGRYQENLNLLYTYDAVVLARKGGRSWYFETNGLKGRSELTASLTPVTEQELTSKLMRREGVRGTGLLNASDYMATAAKDLRRQRANMDRVKLRAALIPVVFPCATTGEPAVVPGAAPSEEAPMPPSVWDIASVDQVPEFPGGTVALQRYISTSIRYPDTLMDRGISGKVYVQFTIDQNGDLKRAAVISGVAPELDAEALRVIRGMPRWNPARSNGRFVEVRMTLPIDFRAR